jgi:DNA mismatch repair ATPase MutS
VQFFLAYLEFLAPMKQAGLAFCYPEVSTTDKVLHSLDSFDLALAHKLTAQGQPTVSNDFRLGPGERVLVVTGPNQGGKTTFARSVAQWHHLASLGCPVPGREARVFLVDRILTHFERQEATTNLRGKLQDELFRIKEILQLASGDSLIIINEMFASTVWQDATAMAGSVLEKILELGAACVWVTFLDDLAGCGGRTVSLVSRMEAGDNPQRTFKIDRRAADGFAYALAIAERHRLTYGQLKERI